MNIDDPNRLHFAIGGVIVNALYNDETQLWDVDLTENDENAQPVEHEEKSLTSNEFIALIALNVHEESTPISEEFTRLCLKLVNQAS